MVKHGLRKSKASFLIFFVVAALFACSLGLSRAVRCGDAAAARLSGGGE